MAVLRRVTVLLEVGKAIVTEWTSFLGVVTFSWVDSGSVGGVGGDAGNAGDASVEGGGGRGGGGGLKGSAVQRLV